MATSFKQVANNAKSTAVSGDLNNTTDPVTFSVQSGDGAKFPTPGNGFWVTVWDESTYTDPGDDPNMEIMLVTSRSTDSMTASRGQLGTSAVAHAGSPTVALLLVDQQIEDLQTAVNTLENASGGGQTLYDCVVAPSGGDYTSLNAAIAAGETSIFLRNGTYTMTGDATIAAGSSDVVIVGESKMGTVLDFGANAYSLILNGSSGNEISGVIIANLTFKDGSHSYNNGVLELNYSDDVVIENVHVSAGAHNIYWLKYSYCDRLTIRNSSAYNTNSGGYLVQEDGTSTQVLFQGNVFISTNVGAYGLRAKSDGLSFIDNVYYGWQSLWIDDGDDVVVSGNTILYCSFGIVVDSTCNRAYIANNRIRSDSAYAIQSGGANAGIIGNMCHTTNASVNPIYSSGAKAQITGNYVLQTNVSPTGDGINVSGDDSTVTSNHVEGFDEGIVIGSDRVLVASNKVRDNDTNGITISSAADETLIVGNLLESNGTNISDSGTNTDTTSTNLLT